MECDSEYIIGNNREDQKAAAEVPKEEQVDIVGVVDDQDVVAGSKITIPEEVLSSFDLDVVLSTGIHIDVETEEQVPAAHATISRTYLAQIDCHQVPDGTLYGAIHYIMENMEDFNEVFSGCKMTTWRPQPELQRIKLLVVRSKEELTDDVAPKKVSWQPPAVSLTEVKPDEAPSAEHSAKHPATQEETSAQAVHATPFRRALVRPGHKISIPASFLHDNYNIETVLSSGLHVQVDAEGVLDDDIDDLRLLKDSSTDGSWMQYKAEGMSKLFERYPLWEIKQWRKVDFDNICVHLIRPTQDWLTDATAANDDINEAVDDQQAVTATHGPSGLDDAGAWEEEDYKHVIAGSAEPGSMLDDEVKAKSFLIPRVKVVIPRRFMEQVMNTKAVLKNGLSLDIVMHDEKNNRESSHAPPSVLAKVHVSVEQFRHAQGYSQYRIDGLKPVCEQYNGWRIFSWVKVDETTAQLRINKADAVVQVKAHDGGADSSGQQPNMADGQAVAPSGSGVNNNPSILGVPRVPVWLRQNQAVSVPRPFMEHLLAVDSVLDNGLNLEVQPEGKLPLPRLLCNVICYKNERGWAQYRIQQDLKSITMQYNGWGVVNWECIDPTTARLVICPPGSEEHTGKTQPLQAATTPLDKGADAEGGDVSSEAVRLSATDEPVASNQQAAVAVADVPVVEGGSGRRVSKGKPSVNEAQNADKPTFVLHRSTKVTKCITLMSPDHFIHVPRTFFQDNYDVDMICQKGLKIQVEANGVIDPEMATACVASYQNNSGYSYFRLLAFKATCRKYRGWRVDSWEVVDGETVKMRISGPFASEEEATLNDAEGEGAPKGRRKRQASVWQEEEEEEEELPVSRQTSNRHAGNPRHVQQKQKQQEQEEVQGIVEEPVTEQPIKAVSPFSSSDFLPDQCTAIQAALRDLAAQHCLNVRSFRDMVLPSPVSLPVATQTEIMSIPFNPGFFEAHFQHCKLPKHITLILNKDGELLEDRYESRILQTSSSRDKSASQEYLFRLPHPLRQEGAGWDIVGLTKVLDGSIMLHLFRPVSGRRGGRKKKKSMADQEEEPTRGKGDAGGGVYVGNESMEELQEDHDAAMAIMTLAQAVTCQPPDSNFNNSADPAGPLQTNYQQGLPRASNSQQGLPRASKEQGDNGNAEFEPVPPAAMTGVEGYMTGMKHQQQQQPAAMTGVEGYMTGMQHQNQQQPAAMQVEDLIAGMQQLPQDTMNLQQGQMEASWGSASIDMQAAQMLSGHAAEHVGMQQQLLGQLGMSMNLAPSQQQQQQLVMAVGPGGGRYLMPVSQGLGQGYASSVPALMTGPDGNQVLVMIPQQQLLQQQQQRLYAAGPSTDGSRYILSSHTGQAGADGSRHSETIEALLQQQQQVELEQQQAALHSLGQQQQQLSPEHQLLVHLGHGHGQAMGSRQVSSLNLSSHRQNVVQGVDSEGAGVPQMLHNDQHIDQLHNDQHMKHEASHSLEHNHVAGSYHAQQQQQQGNPSVVWNGQSLQLVQGGGLPQGLVVGGGRVSNGGGGGAGGMILTAGGGGAEQLLMLGSGGGGGLLTMLPNGQLVALQGGSHLQSPEGDNLGDMLRGSSITGGSGNSLQVLQMNPSGHAGGLLPLGTHQGQQGRVSLLGGGGPQQQQQQQGSFSFGTAHQALQAAGGGLLQHQEGSGQHGGAQPLIMQMHGSGGHLVSLQQHQLGGGGMMQALPHQQQQAMFMASHQGDQQQHGMFTTGGQQDQQHGMFMSGGGQQEQQAPRW